MKTIKVTEKDFDIHEYSIRVVCPYCKKIIFFFEYQKWINKTDFCPNCGKELYVTSENSF